MFPLEKCVSPTPAVRLHRGAKRQLSHQPQIDVGIDFRTDHRVERIGLFVEGLPTEREAEIPLVIQRQPLRQRGDARMLEHVERYGRTDLGAVEKGVVTQSDALIGEGVVAAETGFGAELEGIFQMHRERRPELFPRGVGPLEKVVRAEQRPRTDVEAEFVDERLRAGEAVRRRTPQGFAPHRSGQRHDGQAQQNSSKRSGNHAHGLIRRSWV